MTRKRKTRRWIVPWLAFDPPLAGAGFKIAGGRAGRAAANVQVVAAERVVDMVVEPHSLRNGVAAGA